MLAWLTLPFYDGPCFQITQDEVKEVGELAAIGHEKPIRD